MEKIKPAVRRVLTALVNGGSLRWSIKDDSGRLRRPGQPTSLVKHRTMRALIDGGWVDPVQVTCDDGTPIPIWNYPLSAKGRDRITARNPGRSEEPGMKVLRRYFTPENIAQALQAERNDP